MNYFTGSIPSSIGNMSKELKYIYANNNLLTGIIPLEIIKLDHLIECYLQENFFSGSLPQDMGNMHTLQIFSAHFNKLSGRIPNSFFELHSLRQLFLHSNFLTGPVENIYNVSLQPSIATIDISSNLLTGKLPYNIFNAPYLQSFAAGTNCFTGTLPPEICNAESLNYLSLDGLNTAANCRNPLFPSFTGINTYSRTNDIQGGIPDCLFNMSHIKRIDLCGIGFRYSFPTDLVLSPSLVELSLSNNRISGHIPNSIQTRPWNILDLSYNQLTGTLVTNFAEYPSSSALFLVVNRLSGIIPQSLRYTQNISILEGNLFYCDIYRNPLPIYDSNYLIYSCGSSSLDTSLIIWFVLFAFVLAFLSLLAISYHQYDRWSKSKIISFCRELTFKIIAWFSVFSNIGDELRDCRNIWQFGLFVQQLRRFTFYLTVVIVVFVMPTFMLATVFSNSLTYEFTFYVSMAFISGQSVAFALLVLLILFLAFTTWLVNWEILAVFRGFLQEKTSVSTVSISFSILQRSPIEKIEDKRKFSHALTLTAVFVVNFLVVIPFDALYVIATINYSTTLVDVAQVAIALFKLLWIDFGINEIMQRVLRYHIPSTALNLEIRMHAKRSPNEIRMESRHTMFHVFLVLLNNIAFPCLVIMVISSNCFQNAIFSSTPINTSYTYLQCNTAFFRSDGNAVCIDASLQTVVTTFYPPFQYSYQCSSMFITNFTNIYLYMFAMVGFITPALKVAIKLLHSYLYSDLLNIPYEERTRLRKVIEYLLPPLLQPTYDELPSDLPILVDRNKLLVRTATFISILLTYGAAFGPLAIVICISIFISTVFEQVLIGRLLTLEKGKYGDRKFTYRQIINKETEGISENVAPMIWVMWPFVSLFYAFFIFDIQGSEVGWEPSIWATVLMAVTPILLWLLIKSYNKLTENIIIDFDKENTMSIMGKVVSTIFIVSRSIGEEYGKDSNVELMTNSSIFDNNVSVILNGDHDTTGDDSQISNPLWERNRLEGKIDSNL